MADDVDVANDRAALAVEAAISCAHVAAERQRVVANGLCHNCGEVVGDGMRWCDASCRDDWQSRTEKPPR